MSDNIDNKSLQPSILNTIIRNYVYSDDYCKIFDKIADFDFLQAERVLGEFKNDIDKNYGRELLFSVEDIFGKYVCYKKEVDFKLGFRFALRIAKELGSISAGNIENLL